jgi:hypothetical protein
MSQTSSFVCSDGDLVHLGCSKCVGVVPHKTARYRPPLYVCQFHPRCRVVATGDLVWRITHPSAVSFIPWVPDTSIALEDYDSFRVSALLRIDAVIGVPPNKTTSFDTGGEEGGATIILVDRSPDVMFAARLEICLTHHTSFVRIIPIWWLPVVPRPATLRISILESMFIFDWKLDPKVFQPLLELPPDKCPHPPLGEWTFPLSWSLS